MDQVVSRLRKEAAELEKIHLSHSGSSCLVEYAPILYAWRYSDNFSAQIYANAMSEQLKSKADWLSRQTFDSIDDAIRHFPNEAQLLKILIADCLYNNLYLFDENGILKQKQSISNRNINPNSDVNIGLNKSAKTGERNWVHSLVNLVRAELLDDSDHWSEGGRVKIVSFNYDNSLELILDDCWSSSFVIGRLKDVLKADPSDWRNVFEIVHPHGLLPNPTVSLSRRQYPDQLNIAARQIVVVREPDWISADIERTRSRAREICERAQTIYAMGFAFATSNTDLLGLGKEGKDRSGFPVRNQKIHYINFSNEYGLRDRVNRLLPLDDNSQDLIVEPIRHAVEYSDAASGRLQIHQALMAGFLGEMPS